MTIDQQVLGAVLMCIAFYIHAKYEEYKYNKGGN